MLCIANLVAIIKVSEEPYIERRTQMKRKMQIELAEIALPDPFDGATVNDGKSQDFLVLINSEKDDLRRAAAFLHEMLHIFRGDFESSKSAAEIERELDTELKAIAQFILSEERTFLDDPGQAAQLERAFRPSAAIKS
jgi:hypothetical protein